MKVEAVFNIFTLIKNNFLIAIKYYFVDVYEKFSSFMNSCRTVNQCIINNEGKIFLAGVNILFYVDDIITSFKKEDWAGLGFIIGKIFLRIISAQNTLIDIIVDKVNKKFFVALKDCISGLANAYDKILLPIQQGFHDIQEWTRQKICDGISSIWEALKNVFDVLGDCMVAIQKGAKVIKISFFQIGFSLVVNGIEIYHLVADAISCLVQGNWNCAGGNIIEAVFLVVF